LQNPPRVPKQGRPLERAKRRKTLLEQREDVHKKKVKKVEKQAEKKKEAPAKPRSRRKKIICSYCGEEDHTVAACEYFKAVMAANATPKCQYCAEEGHTVQACGYLKAAMAKN